MEKKVLLSSLIYLISCHVKSKVPYNGIWKPKERKNLQHSLKILSILLNLLQKKELSPIACQSIIRYMQLNKNTMFYNFPIEPQVAFVGLQDTFILNEEKKETIKLMLKQIQMCDILIVKSPKNYKNMLSKLVHGLHNLSRVLCFSGEDQFLIGMSYISLEEAISYNNLGSSKAMRK